MFQEPLKHSEGNVVRGLWLANLDENYHDLPEADRILVDRRDREIDLLQAEFDRLNIEWARQFQNEMVKFFNFHTTK